MPTEIISIETAFRMSLDDQTGFSRTEALVTIGSKVFGIRFDWLGRHQKYVVRIADDQANRRFGNLNPDDPIFMRGCFKSADNPDLALTIVRTSDEDAPLRPSTIASDFAVFFHKGRFPE